MTGPAVPTTPLLTTVPRVELGEVGRWNISNIDGWEPTPDDFASAVAALGCPAVRRPVLKLGHTGQPGAGDPALGYIDNMAITDDGQVLVGDLVGIPAWLGEEDDQGRSVLASAYPDRSGEWEHGYVCQLGHTHPFVLHAMALLGVVRPGIGTLQSLHDLYTTPPPLEEPLMPAASLPSADGLVMSAATTDDVRRAYYDGPAAGNWDLYIREMYVDPPELIVQNDANDSLLRVPYSITSKGVVSFGEPQPVKVTYVNARAASGSPVVAFSSHAEARPGRRPTPQTPPSATPAAGTTHQEGAGMDPAKLREALGLPADAPDADVTSALASAGLTGATPGSQPAAPAQTAPEPEPQLPPKVPSPVASAGSGAVIVDPDTLRALQAQAARGDEAFRQLRENECDQILAAAVKVGKFPPARLDHYKKLWAADPDGTKDLVNGLAANVIPVSSSGYPGVGNETETDMVYAAMYGGGGRG